MSLTARTLLCAIAAAALTTASAAPVRPAASEPPVQSPCEYALGKMAEFNVVCPKDCSKDKGDCKDGEEEDYGFECRTHACAAFINTHFNGDAVAAFASCPAGALPPHWFQDARSIQRDFDHVRHKCTEEPPKPEPVTPGKAFELRTYSTAGAVNGVLLEGSRWKNAEHDGHGQMLQYAVTAAAAAPVQVYFGSDTEWAALRKKAANGAEDAVLALESHGGIFEANNRVSFWGVRDHPEYAQRWKLEAETGDIIPEANPQVCLGWGKVDPKHGHGGGKEHDELILTTRGKCFKFAPAAKPEGVSMRAVRDSIVDVAGKVDGVAAEMRASLKAQMQAIEHLERLIMGKDQPGADAGGE